jgi:hypothetical protein
MFPSSTGYPFSFLNFSFVGLRCIVPGLIERSKIGVVGKLLWDAS